MRQLNALDEYLEIKILAVSLSRRRRRIGGVCRPFFFAELRGGLLVVPSCLPHLPTLYPPPLASSLLGPTDGSDERDAGFDAVLQVRDRISSYIANGHPIDKIEILVLGGTWSEYPEGYQVCRVALGCAVM